MAELITTEEEKAAASYLDWDDAALGRMVKYTALTLEKSAKDAEGFRKIVIASCAMLLVSAAFDANAATLTQELKGHTHAGVPTGDWSVTVKRKRLPRQAHLRPEKSP